MAAKEDAEHPMCCFCGQHKPSIAKIYGPGGGNACADCIAHCRAPGGAAQLTGRDLAKGAASRDILEILRKYKLTEGEAFIALGIAGTAHSITQ